MTYETLNQKQRDDIHKAIADAARAILDSYCNGRGAEFLDHDDFLIEQVWSAADAVSDDADYFRRHECASDIMDALQLPYDDGRIDTIMDLLAQHWDDAEYLMDRIKRHDLPSRYDWLYNARPLHK